MRLLHAEEQVFESMISGWEKQQLGGRGLRPKTVRGRVGAVRRFFTYSSAYPWQWTAGTVDEWMTYLISELHRAKSTLRSYQEAVRTFCDFITDVRYGWAEECEARFGTHPIQVCHEWNTLAHLVDYEGGAERRPMTREELQMFFDFIDDRVETAVRKGRKGALTAYRDGALFKTIYGWGLRCVETSKLETVDLYRNPKAPEFGRFGMMQVRWGKASKGSPPKRRNVHSVMPWAVESLEDYVVNIRPRFGFPDHPALFLTERGGRLRSGEIADRFALYRDELGLPKELTPHCIRHSHVTHQIEDGVDPKFVQDQVGHRYASTTAIYTAVSGDFANTMMRQAIDLAFAPRNG
ncbi:tyrosine-type recombinase/integrase [Streptomyces sp. bgisy130]|uniref:tyrosine-type recombinase/integrase n=1 Tax=Streptomyces sp. bgisy130 TaxID=3413788 RepID=UPI003F4A3557